MALPRLLVAIAAGLIFASFALPATASAATWRTITSSNDRSSYLTLAQISRSNVTATSSLRVLVRAPKGTAKVEGSVFCWDPVTYDYASRDFSWRYRSRGRGQAWTHSVSALGFPRCDIYLSAWGRGGWLTLNLQRHA
jgi:hypothetical protein